MIELLLSDTFWIGFAFGYVMAIIIDFIIEMLLMIGCKMWIARNKFM